MHRHGDETGSTGSMKSPGAEICPAARTPRFAAAAVLAMLGLSLSGCALSAPPAGVSGGHAFVYGISDYEGDGNDLALPATDAENMAALFERQGYTVTLVLDEEVTKTRVTEDLETAARNLTAADTFVFYFAGHGAPIGIEGAEPFPVRDGDSADMPETARHTPVDEALILYGSIGGFLSGEYGRTLRDDELAQLLDAVPAGRKVVILDACNTGGFIGSSPAYDALPHDYSGERTSVRGPLHAAYRQYVEFGSRAIADISSPDTIVITAAGEQEESWEWQELGGGVFTTFFIESVLHGDRNRDGWVSLLEAYRHTFDRIELRWNARTPERAFAPRISSVPVDFVLFTAEPE